MGLFKTIKTAAAIAAPKIAVVTNYCTETAEEAAPYIEAATCCLSELQQVAKAAYAAGREAARK
jgi:hypothetical protein